MRAACLAQAKVLFEGKLGVYQSSETALRKFCINCGTSTCIPINSAEIPRVFLGTMGVPLKVQHSKSELDSTRTPFVVYTTFSQSVANQPCFLGSGV